MSYETYTTEAIVCGSRARGEHDRTLRLYTRDAGMLFARAGGARALQSKLRYGLQDFSYGTISLVRGRHEWRVTGAVSAGNLFFTAKDREARISLLSAMRAVRRLVQGERTEPELFTLVVDGMQSFAQGLSGPDCERLFMLRLLHHLGYIAPREVYADLVHVKTLADARDLCGPGDPRHVRITTDIEQAISASHL